jgi:hypothetical protein
MLKESKDRRRAERHTLNRLARIQMRGGGTLPRDCLVVNISDTGVRLHIEGIEVPEEFVLLLSGIENPRRDCRVVWRLGFELGAEFTDLQDGFAARVAAAR